MNLNCQMG